MDLLRGGLSLFALLNAAGWAALAAAWKFRPEWAERLPLQLGTHERYLKAAPLWARLAVALTGFWALAAALYLTAGHNTGALHRHRPVHGGGGLPDHRHRGRGRGL